MTPTLSITERERILKLARAASLERGAPKSSPIVPVERGGRLALSFAQQRLWFLEQLGELGSTYHIPMRLRLQGSLDRAALARALERIVERHESLRTVFVLVDGEPEQRILAVEESGFGLVEHDLRASAQAEDELQRLMEDEAHAPFDLERGPLFRASLVRVADDDHLLLLTMHHVVSDAWSTGVFIRELITLYAAFSQGEPDPLPPLPVQYADYTAWQRHWVKGDVLEAQAEYWTQTLAGAPELLELPTDHARPARQDHAGATLQVEMGRELTAGLTALSHRHGTTLYMTVMAGWAVVLARLSGQDDVVVGTPSANRSRPEVEDLIGFFVNTLALRVDLSARPTVAELLAQVKTRALEGQRNQDIPFEQVVERLRPARSLAYSPLFQVMLAWQNGGGGAVELPGLTMAPAASAPQVTAKFDLLLFLGEADGQLAGRVEYATSLFEQATVERWVGYLRAVLEAMVADEALGVDRLPMLAEAERTLVLREFNDTRREYPREACVHELVEVQAERTPGAAAVSFEGESLTYAELNARANRLAHHLRALGVGPDVRVGICVERSVEMVVGLLGILKAGGAYVPLDASYPVDRLRNMVEDSAPAVLLTHPPQAATTAALSAGSAVPVLDLTSEEAWAGQPETNPGREGLGPRNLAHVLFTSGSTGRPKGVMLEHGSLVNRLAWMQDRYGMTADEALLQKTPFSFDVSFWEFFWPLMVGARLVMARPDGHRDPAYLVETIRREGITVAHFVPSMLPLFLEHPDAGRCTSLLRVPVSGEAVSAALVRQFHERLPGVGLFNQYGPTESGEVTEWACDPDAERVSIGRAIHNSAVYVLDRAGEPVPVGVAGELFIGGIAVARGYLGRPRLTAERFVPDPFGEPGARMYRTGDLCRWLPDGTVEYLGRTDFQVKVRGFRVELGEIEARLASHPGVRETVVLALDGGAGGKRLVAYFVGEALESEALRAHLSAQLPEYMVPAAFVRLDAFPVTPNGKLDRRALPAPDADAFAARAYEAPLGEMEEALAGIWAELLGAERVGRRDDFFALGGHSLLATRVVSRVRQVFGVEVPLRALFEVPTLAELARRVDEMRRAGLPALPPVVPTGRKGALPLSFAQERLWVIDRMEQGSAAYNIPAALRLTGALDEAALERALGEVVRRHQALRTVFAEADGAPVQVIVPFGGFTLPVEDLSGLDEGGREAAVRRLAAEDAARPFDLSAGPLFRAALLRLGEEDHVLLLSMHHIVSDGWSMEVLFRELSALYAAYLAGRESPLPELAVQYADYAVWQREQLEGEVLDRQLSYWRERLADAPVLLELPTDHPRPPVQTYQGATAPVELSLELLERLQALARSEGATLYMTLLGAFQVLLSKYSGSEDIVVGSPIAGRTRKEIEELIGFFVNTLVLRTGLGGDPSFRETLRRVREATLGAYEHQEVPFEKLVAELQPERSLSHSPLFQVMFTLQNAGGGGSALPGLRMGGIGTELTSAKFDLSLTLWTTSQGLRGGLNYSTDLFERETVERMLGHLARVLEQVAADADVRLSRLGLLGQAERALVLEEWNATDAAFPAGACIHELVEAQAARTPDAVAVSFEGASLTYAELNARANRLAHHLRGLGVGPDARVGVCVERGPEMVAGLLAILKAGGAYVPLDPAYPADRLRYMLEDSAPAALVTQSSLAGTFTGLDVPVVELDAAAWAQGPETNPASAGLTPDHLAYVIYTSGSTGRPKGVMVAHRSLANHTAWQAAAFGIGAHDTVLQRTSISFDASVWELWTTLATGARMLLLSADAAKDPEAIARVMAEEGVTVAQFVPTLLQAVLGALPAGASLPCRTLFCGGEPLSAALVEEARAAGVGEVVNLYGPTEATIDSTSHLCELDGRAPAIGRPIANARMYVLDPTGAPVPVGVAGELYVGGAGLARGYLGRAAMTAERFVPDSFSVKGGARMYRTGDLGRWRADGTLEFLGRTDFQVKVRGFRIELGEIEAALRQAPGVRDSAVAVRDDETGDRRLVAYVVGDAEAEAVRAHVRQSLPEYMVPAAFVVLQQLPLTPNGKLDRKALPAPEGDAYARRSYEAPLGEVETALAEIWADVVGVERVGRWDHFFELGGHSLLAIKVIGRMRRAGLHTDVRALFTTPVLAELALAVGGASAEVEVPANRIPEGSGSITPEMLPLVELSQAEIDGIVAAVPGGAANVQDIYPLAPLQEGFLFHYLLSQEGDPYLVSTLREFDTRPGLERYLAALQAVIDRHDILRTALAWEGLREPVQVVMRHAPLPVEEVEVDAGAGAAGQLWRRFDPRHYRMDLTRAPLLRVCIAEDRARGRWLLLLLMHHVTGDHESLEVLQGEISVHLRGLESELPAPLPFRNYVAQARLGVSREEHERFFRGMLADVEEPTAPYGLLDVWGEGHGIGEARLPVAGELGTRLRHRARALGVSAASLYHLAWAQVLARVSGRSDVVFGTLLFGRMQGGEGTDRVMGPFINTLPVRIGVGEEGVEAAVRRTHAMLADLLRHEHASLALAQRSSGVAAPAPLFTSLLNYRHGGAPKGAQEAGQPREGGRSIFVEERTNYPVVLSVDDRGEEFSLSAQVAAPADAERVCRMMHTALEELVEALEVSPKRAIGSLDVLPEAERAQVLEAWNRTAAEVPADRCIHELFQAQAARTPDAVAVRFEEKPLTYAELNARANRLAHHLRSRGVGTEVRVGVLMERSLEMVVSLLAVLKAGGAYVPLDPGLPAERLAYMLDDSAVPLVLVQSALRGTVPAREGVEVLAVDALAERLAAEPAENPAGGAGPDSLAYVIYTSGSTGRPKGVMNQHRGVVNRLVWMQAHFGIGADDVVLQKTPFGFDVSVWEFFWPLQQGARLVMARPDGHRDPLYLQEVIEREGVTTLHFVPSMLQPFVESVEAGRCGSLRHVVCSGEALPAALVRRFYDRFGGPVVLTNLYGPTEAAVDVSCWTCPRDGAESVVPIGRPVWNTRLYVLDAALEPLPVGVPGELYIGGVQVARGYRGRPAMTAERFVPDPFSGERGARLYRTGDQARWRADGAIEYLGRLDFQVKVRGFRIELGEIEAVLRQAPGVADCTVVARDDETGDRRLVAYVVGDVEAEALRDRLRQSLPEYMVPSAFVSMQALPLTTNGKLDRKALPAPEGDAYARQSYEAPLGEVETALAEIWREVLSLERVGRWDHFFELGGHSLLAIRLIERMRRAGLHTDVRALFTTPVLADLALAVGGASTEMAVPANRIPDGAESITPEMLPLVELSQAEIDGIVAEVPGGAANVQDIYPLAPLQEGILFHHLLSEDGDPYLMSSVVEFDTRARLEQYLAALQAVIDRHDVLRTAVAWEGLREPVQVVMRHAPLPVEEVQLDADAEDAAGQLWRRYDPRHYRMDLARAPLLRACIGEDRARGRWLLLMLIHHLTADHESLEVQREEISAHLRGLESELPAPLPFRNYVAQARRGLSREEHERFFRRMLADVEEPTAPYGLLNVWGEGQGIEEARLPVAGDLGARLRRRARALGVSAASLYHLAWAQVLARLSGRQDVVFGTLLFGRMQGGEGADRVMGPLINTLPVRIGVGEEGVEAAVRRTHALLADLLRHEHASLALAQRSSGVAAPAPLFTSLLNYRYGGGRKGSQEAGQPREGVRGLGGQERTNYPVTLAVDDHGEAFSLVAQVAAPAEAERVCRMMHTALEGLVQALEVSPGRAIGSIDVLPEAERRIVVEEWNRTDAEYPRDVCVHELFEAQVERTPDAVAVRFGEESLTYAELDGGANRLANHLRRRGVSPETRVGICLERGPELVVSLLAVLKAGGAYVPLDPAYPAERLAFMLADSGAPLLLTRLPLPEGLAPHAVEVVCLDAQRERIEAESAQAPAAGARPEQLAYVIYTSGSTGTPKGVMVPHRGVPNLAYAQARRFGIDGTSRILQFASFSFDAAVAEVFDALLAGATLVMAPREALLPGEGLLETLRRERVTVATLPPSVLAMLPPEDLPELRTVVSAGEAVDAATVERWSGGRAFVNAYGPTETTVCATTARCEADGRVPAIGRALENVRVYVLDAAGRPAPVGVPGELYVAGVGVARGYLGRPRVTAERFVPDPFGAAGERLYRTGDRVRWSARGELEFLGRVDEQVKVRGFRIEPGEIEARLAEHAGVREAVVLVREDVPGEKRLVAYVAGDETAGADVLRAHLSERLPEYMVPAAYVRLETLPLTPNGKVDRKALPAPEGDAFSARGYEAPSGRVEEAAAAIWAELLGAERVGRHDHFFELGGHSLLAVRVVSRVRQALGVEAAVRDLFVRPVLADFARGLETAARAEGAAIEPVERSGPLALSFAQQRLWFIEQMEGVGAAYHIPMRLRLRGELDRGALVRALDRIVARHEVLRTTFPTVDGEPVQHIAAVEESAFRLVEHDLRALPDAEGELRRLVQDEASAPFDLAQGPLFRGRLVRMAADDTVLLLTMHHIISDAWSMGIFTRELSALYQAFRGGSPDPLPPLPVQYADYAVWQRRWAEGPVLEAQAEYWTRTLSGAPALLELPTDRPRPAKQDLTGASVRVELDEALTAALRSLSQRHGTTLFMTLLAGWAAVLARLSGQDDVVIGTPSANRGQSEIEGLIGFFINTLPLRVDLSGAPTVAGLLDRVRTLALEAQQNQDIPFEQVVERVHPTRSLSHSPLFQAMFTWQNAPGGSLELPGLAPAPLHPAGSGGSPAQVASKFDLSLTLWEGGGRIVGDVTYATALFDQATVERWLGYLRRVLDEMVADDAKQVHRVELLDAAERRVVVEEWNATDTAFPDGACVHELFQAQVERTPHAVAVSFAGERLTYAELNARANRVAHHLRALGVGPEVRVAVCVRRGMETVVSLLAVLKAGGVYVPLDLGNPDDRLRYMLADSAPAVLLTGGPAIPRFTGAGVPLVDVDAARDAYPASDPDRAEVGVGPEHLAYAMYTSGSTGRPKGVLVRHASLVNLLADTRAAFGVGPGDVLPALVPSAFDISLFELLLPLVSGAELRLVPPPRLMDPRALLGEIADATLLSAVPTLMRDIVQAQRRAPRLDRVRGTFVGGEQVPADLLAEIGATFPGARTYVLYGPTEATVLASAHEVPAGGAVAGYPIGRPLGNVRLYVCDAFGEPQPLGVAGELLIGGVGVARGYVGRPALTAEHFVPDPFSGVPGARLYRSGDRARWKEVRECESAKVRKIDGDDSGEADSTLALSHSRTFALDFLGRTDFQVQIRGIRIELGEIEARLREHPAVREAVVLLREDAPGKKRLVAYVVGDAPAEALTAHLAGRVPGYMVPVAYVRLEALPLTSNGKVDRGALPVPDGASFARRAPEPPRTMTEQVLASIWTELLGVQRINRRDHFFDLGGHSLLAVRMVGKVREALNPAATVDEVFAYPTLYELAARLQGSGEWYGTNHAIPIRETGSERPLFVMHDAVGIVFYGQILRPHLNPEIPIYALPGPLNDTEELASMDDVVNRLVRMMTEVQPEGPYRMAGWSAGGTFAYAAAERLVSTGRTVEFVGLLDSFHPAVLKLDSSRDRQFTVLELLARDSGLPPATPEALEALKEDTEGLDLPAFIAACKARALLPETLPVARAQQVDNRISVLKRSYAEYRPGPLPLSVTIFASEDAGENPLRGWEDIPGHAPFRLERVPGTHHTIWKKGNVEVLGEVISRAIRVSSADGGAGSDR